MFRFTMASWLKKWTRRQGRTIEKRPRIRLRLEELESRLAPASVWTGGGGAGNPNWSNAANWLGGTVPTTTAPVDLVFNSSATFFTSVDDIPSLTVNNFTVASGTYAFSATGGATFTLGNAATNSGFFLVNTGAAATSSIDMILGASAGSTAFVNVQSAATLTLSGRLSGNSSTQLIKQGAGTLTLSNDNSNFSGPFKIDNAIGNGIVAITNEKALGFEKTSEVQTLTLTGATAGVTKFTLTFPNGTTNPITPALTYTGTAADATAIQGALNTLFNGLGFTGSPVAVTQTSGSAGNATFVITFGGSMAVTNVLQLAPALTAGSGTITSATAADGAAPNLTTVTTDTQLQINIAPGGTIKNPLSLNGAGPGGLTGALSNVNGDNTWAGAILMNSTSGINSTTFGVVAGNTLTITGQISNNNAAGYTLEKVGPGALYLNPLVAAGNTYTATTNINAGVLSVGHPFALGAAGGTTNVLTNILGTGSIALNYTGNSFIPAQYLHNAHVQTLSFANAGGTTRFNLSFNGVSITTPLSFSATPAGATAMETALNALSTISGVGASVTVSLNGTNFDITFGGSLSGMDVPTINAQIVAGPGTVTSSFGASSAVGFDVPNEILNLTGAGANGNNTIANLAGQNSWSTRVNLIGSVNFNVAANTNLTMAGGLLGGTLTTRGQGRLILPTVNTFTSAVSLQTGIINIRDSQALGNFGTSVANGATLELQTDSIPDSLGYAGTYNLYLPSSINFTITGQGLNNTGALRNVSGVNKFEAGIAIATSAWIGVEPDPDPLNLQQTTFNNLSQLIVDGVISGGGASAGTLNKVGFGELVLTNANTYKQTSTGRYPGVAPQTEIQQGWITVQNNLALGGFATTTDSLGAPVQVDNGGALVLKQDLRGNNLSLRYNLALKGTGINHRFSWLNQKGALVNLDGSNTLQGYIFLNGAGGIGVELDGSVLPTAPVSELTISALGSSGAYIGDGISVGQLVKLGSQRLIVNNPGTYTGGVSIREGVLRIANDTALGLGNTTNPTTTTVVSGAALEIAQTVPQLNGGIQRGLQIWYTQLVINGTGNSTFGDAPVAILGGDVAWRGPVTLNANIAVTFKNQLANQAVPTMTANATALPGGTINVSTSTSGSSGVNAVQTLNFLGTMTSGTFRLTLTNAAGASATTGPITWTSSIPSLIDNIQQALNAIAPTFGGSVAAGIATVARNSPTIDIAPNGRFVVTGVIDDGGNIPSPLIHDYELNNNFTDSFGGPALVPTGGSLTATRYTWSRVVGANEGLTLTGALPNPGNYSIEMKFNFTQVPPPAPTGYNRILDFHNRTSDNGLYEKNLRVDPFPGTSGPTDVFQPGVDVHLVITRDGATGQVIVYINGAPEINIIDPNGATNEYISSGNLNFFIDDLIVPDEVSAGSIDFIHIYNRPLTVTEVNTVFNGGTIGSSVTGAADLTVSGSGELVLAGANAYRGTTFINQGIVTAANNNALGTGAVAETQTLTFNTVGTQYTLAFNGSAPSAPITYTGTAADLTNISNALNSLNTIGGVGATASVTQLGSVFRVTLNGTLAGFDQSPIVAAKIGGPGTVVVATVTDGAGGTVVADGAQLQLQGSINVTSEPLRLQGVGTPSEPEVQSVTVAGTTAGGFNLTFTNPNTLVTSTSTGLPAGATGRQVQAALNQMLSIQQGSGAGGGFVDVIETGAGVYRITYRGTFIGATNLPIITATPRALQVVTVTGTNGAYRLNFTGFAALLTVPLAPTLQPSGGSGAAASVENALNAVLANAGAPGGGAGKAFVVAGAAPGTYQVTFGGSLAGASVPLLVASTFTGNTSAVVASYNNALTFSGRLLSGGSGIATPIQWFNEGPAPINNGNVFNSGSATRADVTGRVTGVVVDPSDPNRITISTAGGGAWKTVDGGATWSPLFDALSAIETVQLTGLAGSFTLTFNNPATGVGATTAPLPYNATADQVQAALNGLNSIGGAGASVIVNSVATPGVDEVQRINLTAAAVAGTTQFTVKFGSSITAPILYTGTLADPLAIENALNSASFATIGGAGGRVTVTQTAAGIYSIRFGGTLSQQPQTFVLTVSIVAGPVFVPSITVLTPGALPFITHTISFSGGTLANLPLLATSFTAGAVAPATAAVTMVANGVGTSAVIFGGTLAVAPSDPATMYFGTGEGNNALDTYYGSGVYVTHDYGQTWNLVTDPTGNPLSSLAVTKIVVDRTNPNRIYVATADRAINTHNNSGGALQGVVGIWRYDITANQWANITATAFPSTTTNYTWSDVALTPTALYAAGGKNSGDPANLVYVSNNPGAGVPTWNASSFPAGGGTIKITAVAGPPDTVYASVATTGGTLSSVQISTNSGATWAAVPTAPANYLAGLGFYANSIVARAGGIVYVAGSDSGGGPNFVLQSVNNGTSWTNISVDGAGNGPHTDVHSLAIDSANNLIVGTDGGVWRYNGATWSDLNGNLAISNINGVATNPTSLNNVLIGTRNNGLAQYSGTLNWNQVDTGDSGIVLYDPNNPLIAYHDRDATGIGTLMRSTDGGATWASAGITSNTKFPFAIFASSSALVIGGNGLRFWPGAGGTTNLAPPIATVTALAVSTNQGAYQVDPAFPTLVDLGSDNPDPKTVYITGGTDLFVTKNLGITWSTSRVPGLVGNTIIQDIVVDPTNRDHVYVVTGGNGGGFGFTGTAGVGRIFESKNAGQTWTDISAGLPDSPAWKLVVDSRNSDLYLGNDLGVYKLAGGVITATNVWQRFGANLPYVAVHYLDLNQSLNVLTAGTYGRSAFQFFLTNSTVNTGALRAAGGSNIWNGPIILTGATTIGAQGTKNLNNGLAVSQLSIFGTISDLTAAQTSAGSNTLTKVGLGDIILGGTNTYGGQTFVNQGNLVVQNPGALGATTQGTTVANGAVLQLNTSLNPEPLFLFGNGVQKHGHFTGALENASGNNSYAGPITLMTNATIGADPSSTLSILSPGTITDSGGSFQLTKEGTGTLILAGADTYHGGTVVTQGVLNIQNDLALGAPGTTTTVLDDAQLQLQAPAGAALNITTQNLILSGDGPGTGALLNVSGANTWGGPAVNVTISALQSFSPNSIPAGAVVIGVANAAETLTIASPIGELASAQQGTPVTPLVPMATSLAKAGPGTLTLTQADTYSGSTHVLQGELRIQNSNGLGLYGGKAVQRISIADQRTTDTFSLSFNGATTPLLTVGSSAGQVQSALNNLSSITGNGVHVGMTEVFSGVSAVQTMTLTGTQAGSTQYTVSINGIVSAPITYTGVPTGIAGDIVNLTNALNTLTAPGTFTVTADPTDTIFTITFGGSLQQSFQPRIVAQIAAAPGRVDLTDAVVGVGVPVYVYTVVFDDPTLAGPQPLITVGTTSTLLVKQVETVADGSFGVIVSTGASLGLDGDPTHNNSSITVPAVQTIALNGAGNNNVGALHNVSGNNAWNSSVYLQSDASIGANATTQLRVNGVVQDATPAPVAPASLVPSSLTKVGTGNIVFPNANTYTGNTTVSAGVLRIQNPNSLGINTSSVQSLSVSGTSGTFALFFSDTPATVTTGALPFNLTASALQAALNSATMLGNASAPGGGGGTATVVARAAGNIFDITFGGTLAGVSMPLLVAPSANFTGNTSATTVLARAGGASRTIVLNGAALQMDNAIGFADASKKPLTLNGQGFNNGGALESATGNNAWNGTPILLASNASIGVDSGSNLVVNQTITDSGQTQTIRFNGFGSGDQYTLTFNGMTTPVLTFSINSGTNANTIENALNNLPTVALAGGSVVVTSQAGGNFKVAFTGAMAGLAWPTLAATPLPGAGTFTINAPTTQSSTSGLTKYGAGTLQVTGTTSNTYTGLTDVHAGTLELNKSAAASAVAIEGDLQVGDAAPVLQVQTLNLSGFVTGDQFTLTYNGNTTAPITYYANATFEAAAIQAAFNLPAILGAGNTATVTATATPGVFQVAFGGGLAGTNPSFVITGVPVTSAGGTVGAAITTPGALFAPNSAIVRFLDNNQNVAATDVLVNADGYFDLNSKTDTAVNFIIVGGTATTGASAGGTLNLTNLTITDGVFNLPGANALINLANNLSMTGGAINLDGAGSKLQLNTAQPKTITASSDAATGDALISGIGTLDLGNATKTFDVSHGAGSGSPSDLFVRSVLAGNTSIVKTSGGRLELGAANTFTGNTRIDGGDVQVDELGQQTLVLTSFTPGSTVFNLTYSNNAQSGTTSTINYTGVPATDAVSILTALTNLLSSLFVGGSVVVTPVTPNVFTIAFTGQAAANVMPLTAAITSGSGSAAALSVNNVRNVILNGGSVSGSGTVGTIIMSTPTAIGMVNPGFNGASPITPGLLKANGNVTWTSNSTFFVELSNASSSHPFPHAGADYDQLYVTGAVTLGNALLDGNVLGGNVLANDTFTILKATGTITGALDGVIAGVRTPIPQDGVVYLNGQKFTLHYNANTVVLTRQTATITSLSFVSSANPSVYGQEVTYTATAVPEVGASLSTSNPFITFTIDGSFTQAVPVPLSGPNAGIVTFKPQLAFGVVWAANSTHTVSATFSDNFNVFSPANALANPPSPLPAPPTLMIQKVNKNTVNVGVTSNPASTATAPVYGQTVQIIGSTTPVVPADVVGASNPTGNVKFIVDQGSASQQTYLIPILPYSSPPAIVSATATVLGNLLLSTGQHTVLVSYQGDTNFLDTNATPTTFTYTVQKDGTVVSFIPAPAPINLGQNAVFNVAVAPAFAGSVGQPQGTIVFYDGSTATPALGSVSYTGSGTVSFSTANFSSAGTHTIIAVFTPTDINYNGSQQSATLLINDAPTQTVVTSTVPASPTFGQQITFNINVSANPVLPATFGSPTGTVNLWDGPVGTGTLIGAGTVNPTTGAAAITTGASGLTTGIHQINAAYSGDAKFAPSTGTVASFLVAGAATTTIVTATPTTGANFGTSVRFTATVSSLLGAIPVNSHIHFWDGPVGTGNDLGNFTVNAAGTAFVDVATLTAGSHNINAVYTDDVSFNFASSTGALSGYKINNAPTTTVLTTNPLVPSGTAVYGQPITLQASVTSPGGTVAVGTVTFKDGATTIGTALVNGSGVATLTINTLTAASHNLSAGYADTVDTYFAASGGAINGYVINPTATQILATDFTTSAPIATLGSAVTFTVKVTTQAPSTINVTSGSVQFFNGATSLGTALVNSSGVATLTTSALPEGTLTIDAVYTGSSPNYLASAPQSLTQIVRRATSITFDPFAAPNNFFGQTLNYSVNVAAATLPTSPAPTGTLTISEVIGSTATPLVTLLGYVGGGVLMPVTGLLVGSHTLRLDYSGDLDFAPSSKTITQKIEAAPTATTVTTVAPLTTPFYGELVTFEATVTSSTATAPTVGSVTFKDGTTTLGTVTLSSSNVVQFTTPATQLLKAGDHSIVAIYNTGDANYASSTTLSSSPHPQHINAATTETVLDAPPSDFGNKVTFTATVNITSGGTLTHPTSGTVTFVIPTGATTLTATVAINSSGVAKYTTPLPATLLVGSHNVTAKYNGNTNFSLSTTSGVQVVSKAGVNITLTPSAASGTLTYGKKVTFTALVNVATGGSPGTPTGTVQFFDGATPLGNPVALVAVSSTVAKAVFTTPATHLLNAGSHTIIAKYSGDGKHALTTQNITYVVNAAKTLTTLISNPTYWPLNVVTTFNATVAATSGGTPGVPTGSVTFVVDGVAEATIPLTNAKTNTSSFPGFQWTFTSSTNHTVDAIYTPDVPNFQTSKDSDHEPNQLPIEQLVRNQTALTFTSTSTTAGVNIKATVTTSLPGGPSFTGSVSFYENGILIGTAAVSPSGIATITLNLSSGTHNIKAVYSGDANYNPASQTRTIAGKLIGRLV